MTNTLKYKAFITYRQFTDKKYAEAVQYGLQKFAKPWKHLRAMNIFRDISSLGATHDLPDKIKNALEESEFLIVMASPSAAEDGSWVVKEINIWLELGKPVSNILLVHTDGKIVWDETNNDFDWNQTTSLPYNLKSIFENMPLWVDLTKISTKYELTLKNRIFEEKIATLASTIRNIPKEKLYGQNVKEHFKFKFYRNIAVSGLIILTIVAVFLGLQAEFSRREVASQLANNWYTLSQDKSDENPLEAFLLTTKAAQTISSSDEQLELYLNRMIHLSTQLPNEIVNLPVKEGVAFAHLNDEQSCIALITDNSKVRVFKLPDGDPLYVPDFVNHSGIFDGTYLGFGEDGVTIHTYINWNHPEPDPDETDRYVLAADWDPENETILTPIDDGNIDPDDLKWTVSSYIKEIDKFDQQVFCGPIPEIVGREWTANGGSANETSVTTVTANGSVMIWRKEEIKQLVSEQTFAPESQWLDAVLADRRLVTLSENHVLVVWDVDTNAKLWSHKVPNVNKFKIAPDNSVVVADNVVYNLEDGLVVGKLTDGNEGGDWCLGEALAPGGERVFAWAFYTGGKTDDLIFEAVSPISQQVVKSHSVGEYATPSEFMSFLENGKYCLIGSPGSFQIYDVFEWKPIASFYFGTESRIVPEYAERLISSIISVEEKLSEAGVVLHLKGGVRLKVEPNDQVTRELRLVTSEASIVSPRNSQLRYKDQLELSPDGRWLASIQGGNLRIWDTRSGYPLTESLPYDGEVLDLQFSDDNSSLLLATSRGTIVTAVVTFKWSGKPSWLEGLGEALTGLTVADSGEVVRLSLQDVRMERKKFIRRLRRADASNPAVKHLRTTFDMP